MMKLDDGKVYLNIDGSEKVLDPTKEEDLRKLAEQAEKGYSFEGGQSKLKEIDAKNAELQGIVDNFNSRIAEAKSDPEKLNILLKDLDLKIETNAPFKDETQAQIDEIKAKLDTIYSKSEKVESHVIEQFYDTEHTTLEGKYTKDRGFPDYDRKAVQEYADKNGILKFETAYLEMNHEDIIKEQIEFEKNKNKTHQEKIKKMAVPDVDGGGLPPEEKKIHNKYSDASSEWLKDIKSGAAESLYTK